MNGETIFIWTTIMRGTERLLVVACAAVIAVLGYKLFIHGVTKGLSRFETSSKLIRITFSGTGPGLVFMGFAGVILLSALYTGRWEVAQQQRQQMPETTVSAP